VTRLRSHVDPAAQPTGGRLDRRVSGKLSGMSFFDSFPSRDVPVPEPAPAQPRWAKPDGTLGGTVAREFVLARAADVVVAVSGLTGYPNGFSFTVTVALRTEDRRGRLSRLAFHRDLTEDEALPPEFLRLGLVFADGSAASNIDGGPDASWLAEPVGPLLLPLNGGGGGRRHDMSYWVWPLPPSGPLTFVCEWPRFGIRESRADVDGALIHDAARRAVPLWPDDRQPDSEAS
jgi:hypothetical protein